MQRFHYSSDTSDPEMEQYLVCLMVSSGFHTRFSKTFEGVKIFAVKPFPSDSHTEVENVLNDCG